MALKRGKRLAACEATKQRRARRGAERAQFLGLNIAAAWTGRLRAHAVGRCDAVLLQLSLPLCGNPVGGPGWREHGPHAGVGKACAGERRYNLLSNEGVCRTAEITRRDSDLNRLVRKSNIDQQAKFFEGQRGDFRVRDGGGHGPGAGEAGFDYHVAPG